MKIVVDVNHPAHVHFFKNFVWEMQKKGHEILITASKKEVSIDLLNRYGFDYVYLGTYGNSVGKKFISTLPMDLKMYKAVKGFKPDIFVGWGSIRAAHVSKLMRKPCINFDDAEHATHEHILYAPFSNIICTSTSFKKNFGRKHITYNGYEELAYIHPKYFTPDPTVLKDLNLKPNDRYIIIRFVSWDAVHDIGQSGLTLDVRRKAIREFEKYGRVLISSENLLPMEFEKNRILLSPEKMHDLLFYATLFFGEGATMASESALLGTPAIYINSLGLGFLEDIENKYELVYNFNDANPVARGEKALEKAIKLLRQENLKLKWHAKKEKLIKDKIDVTKFMVRLIEGYPDSVEELKDAGK